MAQLPVDNTRLYLGAMKLLLSGAAYDESSHDLVHASMVKVAPWTRPWSALRTRWFRFVVRWLKRRNHEVRCLRPFDLQQRIDGKDWPAVGYTMVGLKRLDNLQECTERILAEAVPGDLVETGVWRGGASMFLKCVLRAHGDRERVLWLADSFEGMPAPKPGTYAADADSPDLTNERYLVVPLEQVQANFRRFGLLDDRVRFLKGWFCDTLPGSPIERISLLRLDGDLYESTMDALRSLYPRVSRGGFVVVDDYHNWVACRKAVDEYRAAHGIGAPLVPIDDHAVYWRVGD